MLAWIPALTLLATTPIEAAPRTPVGSTDLSLHARLARLRSDPPPSELTNETSYLVSNERRVDLFAGHATPAAASPGVHLGVGTDPNYFLAAWARSDLVVIVDFDQAVVDLHAIWTLFFQAAETMDELQALWSQDGAERARALLSLRYFDPLQRLAMTSLYDRARADVHERIAIMRVKMALAEQRSFLDDPEQYAHLRGLARAHRIVAVRGDFVADGVLRRIGALLHEHDRPVRTLYLSNIEQYFMYGQTWRANMAALPLHDATVFRTLPARPAGFEYIVQAGADFQHRVASPEVRSVYRLRKLSKGEHLSASVLHVIESDS